MKFQVIRNGEKLRIFSTKEAALGYIEEDKAIGEKWSPAPHLVTYAIVTVK